MPKIHEVCRHVRSKNAGPFWITIDLFFDSEENYCKYRDSATLSGELFNQLFGADPAQLKRMPVDALRMVKFSYPRLHPQGWAGERDMHGGQQSARLLDIEIA